MKNTRPKPYAICIKNKDSADLVVRQIYPIIPDERAERERHLRIIDESGEDYLYPADYFLTIDLPQRVERAPRRTLSIPA